MSADGPRDDRLSARRSGVYRVSDAGALPRAAAAGLDVVSISLAGVASKDALLERFASALAFPDWFGANWDALEECLDDLSWRPDKGHLLLIDGFETLASTARDDFGVLLGLLADVAEQSAAQERAFIALLVDPGRKLALRSWGEASA